MAKQQPWQCDVCRQSGTVEYEPGAGILAVFSAVMADHRTASPDCEAGCEQIRVTNMNYRPPAQQA